MKNVGKINFSINFGEISRKNILIVIFTFKIYYLPGFL